VRAVMGIGTLCLLLISLAFSADTKEKQAAGQSVDSGALGVFMNGQRVATETFSIQQNSNGSVITSEFNSEQGMDKASQSSEMQLSPSGDLRKYEWKESSPEKLQAVVVPNDQFLLERITTNPAEKPAEQPFLLPASTSILDDYFFVDREVLLWKYLATSCRQDKGQVQCPLHQRTQFGTLNPHARSSLPVTVEYSGREKVGIHGAERELIRFDLKSDVGNWGLWLDDQFKLMRIVIEGERTEVVRD
jgi:hypothetical protein